MARREEVIRGREDAGARRYLVEFGRSGPARYLSHLDTARAVQRTFARAGLELALTAGMRPKARLALGLPLPVGAAAVSELAVADVNDIDGQALGPPAAGRLRAAAPPGLEITRLDECAPHLRLRPRIAVYQWTVAVAAPPLREAARRFAAAGEVPFERRSPKGDRVLDLRRYVDKIDVEPAGESALVRFAVQHHSDGAARPSEVLAQLLDWSGTTESAGAERYVMPAAPTGDETDERADGATGGSAATAAGGDPARVVNAALTRLGVVYDGVAVRGAARDWLERHATQKEEERGAVG